MLKQYYTYIMSSQKHGTLYIGVTSDLVKRAYQHKQKVIHGFTSKYDVNKLVYYEVYDNVEEAIKREKRLKKYRRLDKIKLIEKTNPNWNDLYEVVIA